jgi:hypothetical protein
VGEQSPIPPAQLHMMIPFDMNIIEPYNIPDLPHSSFASRQRHAGAALHCTRGDIRPHNIPSLADHRPAYDPMVFYLSIKSNFLSFTAPSKSLQTTNGSSKMELHPASDCK